MRKAGFVPLKLLGKISQVIRALQIYETPETQIKKDLILKGWDEGSAEYFAGLFKKMSRKTLMELVK